ncbi:Nif3-like dinuclear metal center hexameric protein [Spirosoma arcticum]
MNVQPVSLNDIVDFLRNEFAVDRYPDSEQGGVYKASGRPVRRFGLALEPFPQLLTWVIDNQFDALWLHRPWQLDPTTLPPDIGVIYNHLPFDEHLTMSYNPRLATQLGANGSLEPLGYKQATRATGELLLQRPIGMLVEAEDQHVQDWIRQTQLLFGGCDRAESGRQTTVGCVAVVGAMNDALIHEAAGRGAGLYLTGQYRPSAQEAVDETGIAVVAVGHRRSEEWGLRTLTNILHERWPDLFLMASA